MNDIYRLRCRYRCANITTMSSATRSAMSSFLPGMRVSVPFGRRREQVGMVLATCERTALQPDRLKSLGNVIDYEPLFFTSPR